MSRTTGNDRAFELFDQAIELSPERRGAFLDETCGDDERLRAEVEALLSADGTAGAFLSDPGFNPAEVAARMVGEERVGTRIGHYKLLELIGEGGFGRVFLAEQDRPVRRQVALKIIKLGMDTRQVIGRFEAERQALAIMDHPNIAKVLDAGATITGRPYFVMELVRGVPITRYCDQCKLSIRQRLELFVPVCQAIGHAHQKGIIHRDLKPSNVLVAQVDGRPAPRVIDFGIAKATQAPLTDHTLHTEHHQFVGTPAYMSPEQASMNSGDVDTRTDIYSLGVVLYELLTGTTPFDPNSLSGAGYDQIQRKIRQSDAPRPSTRITSGDSADTRGGDPRQLRRLLRGELDWIVLKCLEKDRARRYETAGALASDVLAYLSGRPVQAAPPSRVYAVRKLIQQHALSIGSAAAVVIALAVGLVFSTLSLQKLRVEQERTRAALIEAQRQRSQAQDATESASAINAFVNDMLASADPYNAGGRDITVLEVLNSAAEGIEGKFTDRPLVEIGIRETIGRTFASLRLPARAVEHLNAAYHRRVAMGLADTSEYLSTKIILAVELHNSGQYQPAQALFKEVVEQARQELERDGAQIVPAVDVLARSAGYVDAPRDQLEKLFSLAADRREQLLGPDHPDSLNCRMSAAWYMALQEKQSEAESVLRDVLERMRRVLGPADRNTLLCKHRLARLVDATGRREEGLEIQREALAAAEEKYGFDHPATLDAAHAVATMLATQQQFEAAIQLHLRRLRGSEVVYGSESTPVGAVCSVLAELYERTGNEQEAMRLRLRTLEINRKATGPESLNTLFSELFIGEKLHRDGRTAEAMELFNHAIPHLRRQLREDSPRMTELLGSYAMILHASGRDEDAVNVAREAFDRVERMYAGAGDRARASMARILLPLGRILREQGRLTEAEPPLRRAIAALRETGQERGPHMSHALANLEQLCRSTGRIEEADALAGELESLRAATRPSNDADAR